MQMCCILSAPTRGSSLTISINALESLDQILLVEHVSSVFNRFIGFMVQSSEGHSIAPLSILRFVTATVMQVHLQCISQAITVVLYVCILSP